MADIEGSYARLADHADGIDVILPPLGVPEHLEEMERLAEESTAASPRVRALTHFMSLSSLPLQQVTHSTRRYSRIIQAPAAILACALSTDAAELLTGLADNTMRSWNLDTLTQVHIYVGHEYPVLACAYCPDSRRVASSSEDLSIRVWDRETQALLVMMTGHEDKISSLSFSPDGKWLLSASEDKTARVWDVDNGRQYKIFEGHDDMLSWCCWSPDSLKIAVACDDYTARIWDAESGVQLKMIEGHEDKVLCCQFSFDGAQLLTASEDKTIRLWDTETGIQEKIFEGHADKVQTAFFAPDGTKIVSASDDSTVRIWDYEGGVHLRTLEGHDARAMSCLFLPDSHKLVSISDDASIIVWDVDAPVLVKHLQSHTRTINFCCLSPDGSKLLTCSEDKNIRIWDVANGNLIRVLEGHQNPVTYCSFSPDGRTFVSASKDKTTRLWDTHSGINLATYEGHKAKVRTCIFSPDGSKLISASEDKTMRLWDVKTGETLRIFQGHTAKVFSCCFSPDGAKLASASRDKTVRLWNLGTGQQLVCFEGHTDKVSCCVFSPDGKMIASASEDCSLRIWDIEMEDIWTVLEGHEDKVDFCAFFPDGKRLISASLDKTIRVWDIASGDHIPFCFDFKIFSLSLSFATKHLATAAVPDGTTIRILDITHRSPSFADANTIIHRYDVAPHLINSCPSIVHCGHERTGLTFIHLAAWNGDTDLLRLLLSSRAPPALILDKNGRTALEYAVLSKYKSSVQLLLDYIQGVVPKLGPDASLSVTRILPTLIELYPDLVIQHLDAFLCKSRPIVSEGITTVSMRADEIVAEGSSFYAPRDIWHSLINSKRDSKHAPVPVSSYSINLRGLANHSLWPRLEDTPLHTFVRKAPIELFGSQVVHALIEFKWKQFGLRKFSRELYFFAAFMLLFLVTVLTLSPEDNDPNALFPDLAEGTSGVIKFILQILIILVSLLFLTREIKRMVHDGRMYFMQTWTYIHVLLYGTLLALLPLRAVRSPSQWSVASCSTVLFWINSLEFARGFRTTGPLVRMMARILWDLRVFFGFLFCTILGFSQVFYLIFRDAPNKGDGGATDYSTPWSSLFATYQMMMSNYDATMFETSPRPELAVTLFISYMIVVYTILINLLIAIMWSTYAEVSANTEMEFRREQAKILVDIERRMLPHELNEPRNFPEWLHMLTSIRRANIQQQERMKKHHGHEEENKKVIQNLVKSLHKVEEQHTSSFQSIQTLEENQNASMEELKSHQTVMEQSIEHLMTAIKSQDELLRTTVYALGKLREGLNLPPLPSTKETNGPSLNRSPSVIDKS